MIKREFVENNLLKIINCLPYQITKNNKNYCIRILKEYNTWFIQYNNIYYEESLLRIEGTDFIKVLINTIIELDKYVPNFINNLINI